MSAGKSVQEQNDRRAAQRGEALRLQTPLEMAQVEGLPVAYRCLGQGDVSLLLVHGAGCDMGFWDLQLEALAPVCRLILVDLPGHGDSGRDRDRRYSMRFYSRALETVLRDLGTGPVIGVGHSMGVNVLRELYRAQPQSLQALVALDGILVYEIGRVLRVVRRLSRSSVGPLLWGPWVRRLIGPRTPDWARDRVLASMLGVPAYLSRSYFDEMLHEDTAYNDPLPLPLLAVCAPGPTWPETAQARVRAIGPNCELVMLDPGVSHFMQFDVPQTMSRLIRRFTAAQRHRVADPPPH